MLFECFGRASPKAFEAGDSSFLVRSVGNHTPAGVRVFRKRSFSTCCATFRHFFYLLFRMAWARMLFDCFGRASPKAFEAGDCSFLVRSVGDVSGVFRAAVSQGLGANPAAVRVFRKRSFFYLLCDVSALFLPAVSHGLGANLDAVRVFRKRFAKGFRSWRL